MNITEWIGYNFIEVPMNANVRIYSNNDKNLSIEFDNGNMVVWAEDQRYVLGYTVGFLVLVKTYWEPSIDEWCYLDPKCFTSMCRARLNCSPAVLLEEGCLDDIVCVLDREIKSLVDEIETKHENYIKKMWRAE